MLKKKELLLAALLMTQEEFDKLAAEREKLIVESAALASNGDPLIFDAPNELIVGAADIENNIEMAHDRGAFVRRRRLFRLL